ncbi:MAG TPA: MmcQ/YjbR family DNA-binding protein [Aggregatilineales bacterium]|nr:MmcQ/YjbR family DNA-binding protein [Aggregatilineales bacterium]
MPLNRREIWDYCLSKPHATETYPFGEDTLVLRVGDKMFALMGVDAPEEAEARINLKCDPTLAVILRQTYPESVIPGYHMNKTHWNTVISNGIIPNNEICDMIDHSYDLIVKSLTKKQRAELGL